MNEDLGNIQAFGLGFNPYAASVGELEQIKKALDAGSAVPGYSGGGTGAALLRQDLSQELFMQTFRQQHIRFFKQLYKPGDKLVNTVFEFTRQISLGAMINGWQPEGSVGPVIDSEQERLIGKCKFLSFIREVTIAMGNMPVLGPTPDAVAKVSEDAATHLMTMLESDLFLGNDDINPYAINGLARAAADVGGNNVVDCGGSLPDPKTVGDRAVDMIEPPALGMPNQFWCSPKVKHGLGLTIEEAIRRQLNPGQRPNGQILGAVAEGIDTEAGKIPFEPSVFLSAKLKRSETTSARGQNAPTTPALTSVTAAAPGQGETSLFVASGNRAAGNFYYRVTAVGLTGESAAVTSNVTAVAAGEKCTVTITAPNTDNVLYYRIFRTKPGGTTADMWEIAKVRQTYSNGSLAATVYVDLNQNLPDTSDAFLLENTPDVIRWRELMSFSRIPLALNTLTQRFAFAIFGAPIVTLPRRVIHFKNVGALA